MKRWEKASLITVVVVILLAGLVAFVLPGIIKSQAIRRVEAATGRNLAIGATSINPFTWTVEVKDLRLSERGRGETFATLSSARIAISPSSLYRRAPIIASARIASPHLRIVRVGANEYNFSDLLKRHPQHPQQSRFSLNNLMLTNGSIDFTDRGLSVEKRHELRKIELAVPFITTIPYLADRYIAPRLSLMVNGAPLHLEGKLRPFPKAVEASATIAFDDAALPHYLAYLPGRLPVQVHSGRMSAKVAMSYRAAEKEKPGLTFNGKVILADTKIAERNSAQLLALQQLDVAANVGIGGPGGTRLENGSIQARQLVASAGKGEGLKLASLSLEGGTYSRKENLLEVADLTLRDGSLRLSRDRNGVFLPLPFLHQAGGATGKKAAQPLRYRIGRISGEGLDIAFTDEKLPGGQQFTLKNATLSLEKFIGPPFGMIPFSVAGGYGKGGSLKASGSFCPAPLKIKGNLAMQRVPLTDFDAYFPEALDVFVTAGKLDARLALSVTGEGGSFTGTFGGSAAIRSFNCLDGEGEDLLKWEILHVDRVKGRLGPFALDIGDVALTGFYSRIVAQNDGSLNLQHLYRKGPKATANKTVGGKKRAMVRIGRITMQNGTLSFTDHHVPGGYSTTFFNLGGRVSGLSSEPNRLADVDLRGNLENQSPLRIIGQINPLRGDLFVDLKVSFTDIALSPMSAYAGKYLGYAVENGQLFIYSRYRIENKQFVSENKIVIDQLDFGRRIESDKATSLPVRLAIALLKDKNGEITLDLPVTGRTDDPQFSFPGVVLKILKNLLVTAARSPLKLLHAMFGGEEPPDSVGFPPGSAALSPAEQEKLLKLAAAFNNRPALKVAVTGLVDRDRDDEGYRNELLLKRMRTEKFRDLVKERRNQPEDSPDTMHIAQEEYPRYLKEVYAKEQFPKPRNILGLVKALPEAEMKKLILANMVVGEEQLRGLADARAAAVRAFLVKQGKVDSQRVFQKSGDISRSPAKRGETGSRVEFELTAE
ncbi:DUF748 domain-containing protein [Geotalea sp. SG265]|uniref:DUF748 domain-containing protein n=1 Tax=Geotalea sp. SG265 TaxID=2922867 RepID=UPI001FAF2BDD|nr:DUF748 domain-containing protein [Geotalea sp. SG265]